MRTTAPVCVHYELDGFRGGPRHAPTLVLPSSLGTSIALWDDQLPALAGHVRVLRYDQRGHGRSPVPSGPYGVADLGRELLELLDHLGLDRVSVCGLSLGGMSAIWAASEAPERFDRLVLACTSARLGPPELWDRRAAEVRASGTASIAEEVLGRWLTPAFRAAHPEGVTRVREMLCATPDEGYALACEAIRNMDLSPRLGAIRAPTLVIAGAEDSATPPAHAERIAAGIPDARVMILPRSAHLANIEQPKMFARAVLNHVASS